MKLLVEAVAEGEATGGAVVGSPKGVGARRGRVCSCVLVFEKGREAWKSQSHISAHFAPVEIYGYTHYIRYITVYYVPIEISTVRPSMRGIPYLMDFLDLGNEAHLRPWPKNLRA